MSTQDMLGDALAQVVGPLKDFFDKLAGKDGLQWLEAFKRFLRRENPWSKLLKFITTIAVAGAEKFVAADHFKADNETGVKLWLSDNFKQNFLGKTETVVAGATLTVYEFIKNSLDASIIAELGDRHETSLFHLWELIKKQSKGEEGTLRADGYANIFYIRATDGTLWAVNANLNGDSWVVHAFSVGHPIGWDAGDRLISR